MAAHCNGVRYRARIRLCAPLLLQLPHMDLSQFQEALGDERFAMLSAYVNDLTGQRDAARRESIDGRKGKDKRIQELTERLQAIEEWAGIEPDSDLGALPAPKGAVEAAKQYEAKLKRAERERAEAMQARDAAVAANRQSLQRAAVADALSGHDFVARDLVETYVGQRLTWEDDDLMFKTDDGKLVPVKDGVAGLAQTRPELLRPTGTGGAGVRQGAAGSGRTMPEAQFDALAPAAQAKAIADGYTLT